MSEHARPVLVLVLCACFLPVVVFLSKTWAQTPNQSELAPQQLVTEGAWHWHRDPLQERRRTIRIYNLHCVRCHGVNGRGVWDIPDVPDFTDLRWQQSRSDADIVRLTLGGRGACMPAFKGTISHHEAWAIARYLRTFAQPAIERVPTNSPNTRPVPGPEIVPVPSVTSRPWFRRGR